MEEDIENPVRRANSSIEGMAIVPIALSCLNGEMNTQFPLRGRAVRGIDNAPNN